MLEIPIVQGNTLPAVTEDEFVRRYCEVIKSVFFTEPIWNGTPEFKATFPFGLLIYSNAHPELTEFMGRDATWPFLDNITREKFYVFAPRPEPGAKVLDKDQNEAMYAACRVFGLQSILLNPCLVVFDFKFEHKRGREDWQHIYDAKLG